MATKQYTLEEIKNGTYVGKFATTYVQGDEYSLGDSNRYIINLKFDPESDFGKNAGAAEFLVLHPSIISH